MMQQLFRIIASALSVVCIITVWPVAIVLSTAVKMMDLASNRANIFGILTTHASETSVSLFRTVAFSSHKFSHHSVPHMYVLNSLHCALLLCCMLMTETPAILMVLTNVTVQWVRQEAPLGFTLEIDRKHYFHTNLHVLKK